MVLLLASCLDDCFVGYVVVNVDRLVHEIALLLLVLLLVLVLVLVLMLLSCSWCCSPAGAVAHSNNTLLRFGTRYNCVRGCVTEK